MLSCTRTEICLSSRACEGEDPGGLGSREALIALFVTRRAQLLRACMRWTRGHCADAEDLLADACLRIVESARASFSEVSKPIPFCLAVIANLARDRWRADEGSSRPPPLLADISARALEPEEILAARELLVSMLARSEHLPASQRRALVLRSLGGEYTEIAESLATSPENARKLVQLARLDMRRERSIAGAASARARLKYPRARPSVTS